MSTPASQEAQPPSSGGPPTGAPYAWAPPGDLPPSRSRRPRWLTGLIVTITVVTLVVATAWLQRPPPAAPATAGTALLAPDGHVEVLVTPGLHVMVETAQPATASLVGSGPPAFALSHPNDLTAMLTEHYQRVTFTWTRPESVSQTEEFYRIGAEGASLTTWSQTGGEFKVFQPGVLTLPADIAPGHSWSGEGSVLKGAATDFSDISQHPYSFTARASKGSFSPETDNARNSCIDVEITLTEGAESSTSTRTWCAGRGVFADSATGVEGNSRSQEKLPAFSLDRQVHWTPEAWSKVTSQTLTLPPPLSWNLATAPVDFDGGFIITDANSGDVVATDATLQRVRWRSHPGGTVTHATAAGDLIIVATTQGALVAYDRDGLRRWSRRLPDLVAHPPQRDGDRLIVADVGGRVHSVDLLRGHIVWTRAIHHRIVEAPQVGDAIVVPHAQPGVTVLGRDGSPLWARDLEDPADAAVTLSGSTVVFDGPVVRQFDGEGTPVVALPNRDGLAQQAVAVDGGSAVVARYRDSIVAYAASPELAQTWRVPFAATRMLVVGSTIVAASASEIVVLTLDGTELHRWQGSAASREFFLGTRDNGFFLIDRQFNVTEVGQ